MIHLAVSWPLPLLSLLRLKISVIYINVLPPLDPNRLILHILEHVERTAKCPFKCLFTPCYRCKLADDWIRYTSRLTPIAATGGATLTQLAEVSQTVIEKGFATSTTSSLRVCHAYPWKISGLTRQFAINTNTRSSNRLERLDMIKTVADQVVKLEQGHKVDLENPERTVLIELYKVEMDKYCRLVLNSDVEYDRDRSS